ncbi:hypothetical protein D3C78_1109460 [compost metagenome]
MRAAAAPVQRGRAGQALLQHLLDQGLDGRKARARGQQDDGLVAVLTQVEAAERAFDAQDFLFLHAVEHMVGELAARHVADMQFQAGCAVLQVGCGGHGIGAARPVAQNEFHVLARVVAELIGRGQLQVHLHHVMGHSFQSGHAHRHFPDRESAFVRDLARLQHHVAFGRGAAGEHIAVGFFLGAQGLGLVRAMHHAAAELLAFARTAGAVLAAIGQAHAGADGCGQNGFVALAGKGAAAGLHGDLVGGVRNQGHLVILGAFLGWQGCCGRPAQQVEFCPQTKTLSGRDRHGSAVSAC